MIARNHLVTQTSRAPRELRMPVSYTCPNPDCGVTLKTANAVAPGKSVNCPKCKKPFVPVPDEKPAAGTFKLADDPKPTKPPPKPNTYDDDEDQESIKKGYGVLAETEEEKAQAEKNKPKFEDAQEKYKKSARGPAQAMLVMPANLLVLEGLLTCVFALVVFVAYGIWALVFNDGPLGEEEFEEAVLYIVLSVCILGWGAMICFGASQMQELSSYPWSMIGAVMGIAPALVGLYAVIMLQNPKVKEAFAEGDVLDEEEEEKGKDDEDDEEEDDEEEDDEDDEEEDDAKAKKGKKR
jgi:hypothetical protein